MDATATTALLARACRNCATAKTKCVLQPGSTLECERCHRLKKPCIRETQAKKRKPPSVGKSVRLEKKLDQLVSLLQNPQGQSSISPPSDAANVVQSTEQRESYRPSPPIHGERGAVFAKQPPKAHTPDTQDEPPPDLDPGDQVIYDCLSRYQTFMSKHFPFVVLPPGISVAQLCKTKPFLVKVIVAVASYHDLNKQRELGNELVAYVATNLLMRGQKNLDMLQGLLVFIAWYHPHFFVNPQTSNLLQLAVGLTIDLGLKKSVRGYGKERIDVATTKAAHGELAAFSELHTSDERRALLGTFYLTTIIAQWAKRYDSMRWSAQLDAICRDLERAAEYPSDRKLVALVRLQHIVNRVERKVPFDDFTPDTMIPISMFVKQLHFEFESYKRSLPTDLRHNTTLLMHYYNAELYLYEISLSSLPPTTQYADYAFRRLEMLNACMQAGVAFMRLYHTLPHKSYYNLPFVHFSQLTSAIIALSKLSRLSADGWDNAYAQTFIDFPALLDTTAARYEEARNVAEVPVGDNPLFTFFARKLRFVKAWNEAKLKGLDIPAPVHAGALQAVQDAVQEAEGGRGPGRGQPEGGKGQGEAGKGHGQGEAGKGQVQAEATGTVLSEWGQEDLFNVFNPDFWQEMDVDWDLDFGGQVSGWGAEDGPDGGMGALGVGVGPM